MKKISAKRLREMLSTARVYGESRTDASRDVDVSTVETDGWYRVVGSGVAVFTQATNAEDAKKRVMFMINRISMDASLELYITRRDPEVN